MMTDRRHGVVLLAALLIVPLIAVAITAISAAASADARRGMDQARLAQLDQLLIAGAHAANYQLLTSGVPLASSITADLPASLANREAQLAIEVVSRSEEATTFRVRASLDRTAATQNLRFRDTPNGWILASVERSFD